VKDENAGNISNGGDGFSGVKVNIFIYRNFSYASIESYNDKKTMFDFLEFRSIIE
jgi:hypothetical protein